MVNSGEAYDLGYEQSACPVCGDPACKFPPECQDAIGVMPPRSYPFQDED